MKQKNQFNSGEEHELSARQESASAGQEFATPEALLRHDAIHTPVPPRIAERLAESIAASTPPPKPWWRRIIGG
jgi:hypothetical protein